MSSCAWELHWTHGLLSWLAILRPLQDVEKSFEQFGIKLPLKKGDIKDAQENFDNWSENMTESANKMSPLYILNEQTQVSRVAYTAAVLLFSLRKNDAPSNRCCNHLACLKRFVFLTFLGCPCRVRSRAPWSQMPNCLSVLALRLPCTVRCTIMLSKAWSMSHASEGMLPTLQPKVNGPPVLPGTSMMKCWRASIC